MLKTAARGDRRCAGACAAGICRQKCFRRCGRSEAAARATIRSPATFVSRRLLNKKGSEKETWHVEFDLAESELDYAVGDAFGLFPTNDPALVDAVIAGARRAAGLPDRRPRRCARC